MTPTDAAPSTVEVRPALARDVPQMALVHVRARERAPMPSSVHNDTQVQRWLAGRVGADEMWVAVRGTRVVGYARFGPGWLDDLYVLPDEAGRGVGTALLDVVKARLSGGFCLWVFVSNAPAREFYSGRGLVELEHTDGQSNPERTPDLKMAWPGAEPLAFLRSLIDDVDVQFGDLLARRAALTAAVQDVKRERGLDTRRDAVREREVAERVASYAPALPLEAVATIMDTVIAASIAASAAAEPPPTA